MTDGVRVIRQTVPVDRARAVVLGYCLGSRKRKVLWQKPTDGVGDPLEDLEIRNFAYGTYDCIPGSKGRGLEPVDVLVANGLNARMASRPVAAVLEVQDEVSHCLRRIPKAVHFWDLTASEVVKPPDDPRERAWPIWRAWTLLMGIGNVKTARAHKILHHKRPDVFPLLDQKTARCISGNQWGAIHDDLTSTVDEWKELEDQVNGVLRTQADCVELTRLRLHDILLWCRATDNTRTAARLGRTWLARHGG